jgi:hypothetical protein
MSDRRFDTISAITIVVGVIIAGFVMIAVATLFVGPWLIQRGFTTDVPK